MFEIGIFCIIVLATGYWTALFIMGRREDVLHGQFVEADAAAEPAPAPVSPVPRRPRVTPPVVPVANEAPAPASGHPESLQSLLAALKQELKNAAQI